MTAIRTAAITNLGCKVNQSEMEAVARLLRERGVRFVDGDGPADLHVVNTCTVTAVADQKSRQAVRRARRSSPDAQVVVTGCSVQVAPAAFASVDPQARLVDNRAKDGFLDELAALIDWPDDRPLPTISGVEAVLPEAGQTRWSAPLIDDVADGRTIADRTRAFVKVQDGCSFFCTYCIIPRARGPERSLTPDAVLADVRRAIAGGHREIVLTGINIGTYDGGASERGPRGSHRWAALSLAGLIRRLLAETSVERIRLSSIEPQHVTEDLLAIWQDEPRRCLPHFHLPLQSGDDGVLRRMGRRYDTAFYARLVGRVRERIVGVAVHADVIVGFPTEEEAAWVRTKDFVRSIGFAGLHVFRYSARPGTPATRMTGQIDEAAKKRRSLELLGLAAELRAAFAEAQVGRTTRVLFETRLPDGRWSGHAENHVVVAVAAGEGQLENAIGLVRIDAVDPEQADRLMGSIIELDRPNRRLRPALPTLTASAAVGP